MVNKPTVFVLGAGASHDFGFPLGKNLVDLILQNLDHANPNNSIPLFTGLGFTEYEIISFRDQLKFSATSSIDSFLEQRQGEERYLGKLAIAHALIPFERKNALFEDNSWYKTLINAIKPSFADFEKNRISFITFNYDRSLEYFLMTSLMNRFQKNESEVYDKLRKIPIIHLYGKLGILPWEKLLPGEYAREYSPAMAPHHLRKSSLTLKIIYDKIEPDDQEFLIARQLLKGARKIYFLGFGYHKDNLERLKLKTILNPTPPTYTDSVTGFATTYPSTKKIVQGTSFKLPSEDKVNIPKTYKIVLPNSDLDINNFFEQIIRLE